MKKIAVTLMVAAICAAPSLASAATPYVRLSSGVGLMNDSEITGDIDGDSKFEYDGGFAVDAGVGLKMGMFRVEAATGYQSNNADKYFIDGEEVSWNNEDGKVEGSSSIQTYMVNGYADFDTGSSVSPFVMAGLGMANVESKLTETDNEGDWISWTDSNGVFAWQVGAGVGVKVAEHVTVDLSYRYLAPSDVTTARWNGEDIKQDMSSSNFLVGMRYDF